VYIITKNTRVNRVPTLLVIKIPGLFQDPQNVFPELCCSQAMLHYRQTAVTYSVYTVWQYNPSQNVHHKLQSNRSVSILQEYFVRLFTHGVLYIKGMLVKLNHSYISGLSRSSNFNFQDFPGPGNFREKNPGLSMGTRSKSQYALASGQCLAGFNHVCSRYLTIQYLKIFVSNICLHVIWMNLSHLPLQLCVWHSASFIIINYY